MISASMNVLDGVNSVLRPLCNRLPEQVQSSRKLANGKFHGVIMPTTPTGSCTVKPIALLSYCVIDSPLRSSASLQSSHTPRQSSALRPNTLQMVFRLLRKVSVPVLMPFLTASAVLRRISWRVRAWISTSVPDQRSAALPELLHLHPLGYSGNLDNSLSGHWAFAFVSFAGNRCNPLTVNKVLIATLPLLLWVF